MEMKEYDALRCSCGLVDGFRVARCVKGTIYIVCSCDSAIDIVRLKKLFVRSEVEK